MDLVSLLSSTTSKGNPNAWDVSKAYYDAGGDAWDISKAFYSNVSLSITGQETVPGGLFFKTDGTKMYVSGGQVKEINEYTLSTPWLVSSASFVTNFSISAQGETYPSLFFKPDGTKFYTLGRGVASLEEYDLSTAWDISSASHVQSLSLSSTDVNAGGVFFKSDGLTLYFVGMLNDKVYQFSLSTAWDISTATFVQDFSISAQEATPTALFFGSDGTKMYVMGFTGDDINEYALSTAWDISTASYVQNFSVSSQDATPTGLYFTPNGAGFYVCGDAGNSVYQYSIGGFSVAAQETAPNGLFFKPDGTKMYIIGRTGDDVNEYGLSTAWDIATASYTQNFSVAGQETNPYDIAFKSDGTKMYICGGDGRDVNEYSLSTAWDISTASYVQNFSIAAQDAVPYGMCFSQDGTNMYIAGYDGQDINQYSLSTAWDISTASYVRNFSYASQDTRGTSVFFDTSGLYMYVHGAINDFVNQYVLTTPWDISTASYLQHFYVRPQDSEIQGIFWKDDGTQFFAVGLDRDRVFSYLISEE